MKKSNIARAIKHRRGGSLVVECQIDGGTAYVTNGFVLLCIAPEAHNDLIKPITGTDAGNYRFQCGQAVPTDSKLHDIFIKHVKDVLHDAGLLENPGMTIVNDGVSVAGLYNLEKGFPVLIDSCYLTAFPEDAMLWGKSPVDPVVVTDGMHNLLGLIMPIKPRFDNFQRAVKSYYTPAEEQPEPSRSAAEWMEAAEKLEADRTAAEEEAAAIREQMEKAENAVNRLSDELEAANAYIAELQTALGAAHADICEMRAATITEIPQETKTAKAADPAAIFADLPGITATVKGAKTASPVVWLSGNVAACADTLRSRGAKWSGKRNAWYYSVA